MNKTDLVSAVAEKADITKTVAATVVDAVFDAITESLAKKDEVRLVGFGTFLVSHREASTGRHPKTGAPLKIAASYQPKFRAGKGLKDAVN